MAMALRQVNKNTASNVQLLRCTVVDSWRIDTAQRCRANADRNITYTSKLRLLRSLWQTGFGYKITLADILAQAGARTNYNPSKIARTRMHCGQEELSSMQEAT
jgi:hypothetical protein